MAAAGAMAFAAPADAARVLVLQRDGDVAVRNDPGVAPRGSERPALPRRTHVRVRAGIAARRKTVISELKRLRASGAIDTATYRARREVYDDAKAFARRLPAGRRKLDMNGAIAIVESLAARSNLNASRLEALFGTLQRNQQWWSNGPLLGSGQRVSFTGSELVWQYVPGQGLAIHPLANFGKLNALWRAKRSDERLEVLLDELLALPAVRAGGLAWEYYFAFGGGRPPWVSGLAQGTALQALARAGIRLDRKDEVLAIAKQGLGIFRTPPPDGIRVEADGGIHYLQYSFARSLFIFNGFTQALVGLSDYGAYANDPEAMQLFADGERAARVELPGSDTGAWSLYSRGSSTHESSLEYHKLYLGFLQGLCERTLEPAYCDTADRFEIYLAEDPQVRLLSRRLRGGTASALRLRLSKMSRVGVRVSRGDRVLLSSALTMAYGSRSFTWRVPRQAGLYDVRLTAVDLAGNTSVTEGQIEVLKPRRRRT
jgi:hypothetical protein